MSATTETDVDGPALESTEIYLEFDYDDAGSRFDALEWASLRADQTVDVSDQDGVSKNVTAMFVGDTEHLEVDGWTAMDEYDGPGHYEIEVVYRM